MTGNKTLNLEKKQIGREKILLGLLPYWDPQIPPLGIGCLKSFLQRRNYRVKTIDANLDPRFRGLLDNYFQVLEDNIPVDKKGNLHNIGNEVLKNHMMAHIHYTDEAEYMELVKILVFKTFYYQFDDRRVGLLNSILDDFYGKLETYFLDLLEREKPTVLGLSVYSGTLAASVFAFKLTRQKYPHIKTVMGGGIFSDQFAAGSPNLAHFAEKTRDYIDKIIIGEGELLFLQFLQDQLDPDRSVCTLKDIDARTVNLTSVDIPDFSDFDLGFYPHLAHYGSRSCPFQCSFCSETVNWGIYRKKKAKQTVEELTRLYKTYAYQLFLLTDSLLNPIATDLANEIIKAGVSLYWDGFLRADPPVCNVENTLLWRRGGFYRAKLGLESGSPKILELMGKRITVEQIRQALASLARAGIKTTTFWVIGHPGETEADFRQTLDLLAELKDDIYEADCNPFYYYLSGQSNSGTWMAGHKQVLLYPEWANDMLVSQTWRLDCQPLREETYERVNRFIVHCRQLGIPNPYSLRDIYEADDRWQKLHQNAVPPLVDLRNKAVYIDESKKVEPLVTAVNKNLDAENFDF